MENNKTIVVGSGNYFKTWASVFGIILFIFGIASAITNYFLIFHLSALGKILIVLLTGLIFMITCFTKKFFEFDPITKKQRYGIKLFSYKFGEWSPFEANCTHFAFQRYEESINYDYGGLTNKNVSEEFYELRKITGTGFVPIVKSSKLEDVIEMVKLGKTLSQIYRLPFHDYVRGIAKKKAEDTEL